MKLFTKSKHRLALLALFAGGVANVSAGETTVYENGIVDLQDDIDVTTLSNWSYDGSLLYMVQPGVFFPFPHYMNNGKTTVTATDGNETQTFEVFVNQNESTIVYMPTYDSLLLEVEDPLLDLTEYIADTNVSWYFDDTKVTQEGNGVFSFKEDGYTHIMLNNKTTQAITLFWISKFQTPDNYVPEWDLITFERKTNHIENYYTLVEGNVVKSSDPSVLRVTSGGDILALKHGQAQVYVLDNSLMDTLTTVSVSVLDRALYMPLVPEKVHDFEVEYVLAVNDNALQIGLNLAVAGVTGLQDYIYVKVRYITALKSDDVQEKMVAVKSVSLDDNGKELYLQLDESIASATEIEVVFLEGGITGADGIALSSVPAIATVSQPTPVVNLGVSVTIQPNPCEDVLTVVGGTEVTIINLSGNVVFVQETSISGSTIDVSFLSEGMYVAVVKSAKGTEYVTFTKE